MNNNVMFHVEGNSDAIFIEKLFLRRYPHATINNKNKHKILTDTNFGELQIHAYSGKTDLMRLSTEHKAIRFLATKHYIIFDKDDRSCKDEKATLLNNLVKVGFNDVTIIVACRELETWFCGDEKIASEFKIKTKSKNIDSLTNPCQKLGIDKLDPNGEKSKYAFAEKYSKSIILNAENNSSPSFSYFLAKTSWIFLANRLA